MSKRGILFIDDEPHILSAMKRLLRPLRHDFEFYFCENGPSALQIMESHPIHVVVSDMKMPGMSGPDLLLETQTRFPNIVRIMLTGQADEESAYKAVNVVHQFLAKPCNPEKVRNVIIRAAALHDLLTSNALKEMITGVGSLPVLPSVYSQLQNVLRSPDVVADDVAKVIEFDIAITAKLLQLLNSSFFGLFTHVDSPARAVKLLGLDTIKILVLGLEIFSEIKTDPHMFSMDELWKHSLIVAKCSKAIATESGEDISIINDSYISGMLHDLGKLLLVAETADTYYPILQSVRENKLNLSEEEHRFYGGNHSDVGAYLSSLWGFNADIIEAIAFHDNCSNIPHDTFTPALAVHIANFFYHQNVSSTLIGVKSDLDTDYIERLGMTAQIPRWSHICRDIIAESVD